MPEVQLLFKSTTVRPKDALDFRDTVPLLGGAERAWLRDALRLTSPGHEWLRAL